MGELLILNGWSIFSSDNQGWTPMHHAVHHEQTSCAVILHKHGFNGAKQLECKDKNNKTAVELALIGKANDILTLLINKGDEKSVDVGFSIEDLQNPDFTLSPQKPSQKPTLTIDRQFLQTRPTSQSRSPRKSLPGKIAPLDLSPSTSISPRPKLSVRVRSMRVSKK